MSLKFIKPAVVVKISEKQSRKKSVTILGTSTSFMQKFVKKQRNAVSPNYQKKTCSRQDLVKKNKYFTIRLQCCELVLARFHVTCISQNYYIKISVLKNNPLQLV